MTSGEAQPSGGSAKSTSPPQPAREAPGGPGSLEVKFTVRPRQLVRTLFIVCVSIEAALFFLDYQVNYGRLTEIDPIRRLFNTTREDGLASWMGVTQTALTALTLWLLYATVRKMRGASKWQHRGWLILALFVTYMAADDGATIHERMGSTFREVLERPTGGGAAADPTILDKFPSYPWQVLFVPVFGALGVFMLVFLWRQMSDRTSRIMVLGTIGCFAFAVGLDFLEGLDPGHRWNVYRFLSDQFLSEFTQKRFGRSGYDTLLHFSKSLEEVVEMFGMTLLWLATLRHWMSLTDTMRLRFDRSATKAVS
ncbi:MAG: hypothetical protein L0Y44_00440 [Phycisphaerales bacterium]|nr:hypothetical protein [Phycisphaerales bacterium]MCI0629104.1 hypothetical protein [Phycisphaerales bacterium]MCI0675182.1 hypothetical protein [Phycisphaerales bacterium]